MENVQAPWVGEPPEEPEMVCRCDWCNKPLYEGDEAYEINDYTICESCARDYFDECRRTL